MDTTIITPAPPQRVSVTAHDQFITDALAFINSAIDTYPLYGYELRRASPLHMRVLL